MVVSLLQSVHIGSSTEDARLLAKKSSVRSGRLLSSSMGLGSNKGADATTTRSATNPPEMAAKAAISRILKARLKATCLKALAKFKPTVSSKSPRCFRWENGERSLVHHSNESIYMATKSKTKAGTTVHAKYATSSSIVLNPL